MFSETVAPDLKIDIAAALVALQSVIRPGFLDSELRRHGCPDLRSTSPLRLSRCSQSGPASWIANCGKT